jgi:hypothetical protein
MTLKSENTLRLLREKSTDWDKRMPPIKSIHAMLEELGIAHTFRTSTNVVEYKSKGNRYVNSRHDRKEGYKLTIGGIKEGKEREAIGTYVIELNTADSYYSYNSTSYAKSIISLIDLRTDNN